MDKKMRATVEGRLAKLINRRIDIRFEVQRAYQNWTEPSEELIDEAKELTKKIRRISSVLNN